MRKPRRNTSACAAAPPGCAPVCHCDPRSAARHGFRIRRTRGFSLLELVMVLMIIGMLASMALPRYGGSITRQSADGAARRMAADLEWARELARSTSSPQTFRLLSYLLHDYELVGVSHPDHPDLPYTVSLLNEAHGANFVSIDLGGDNDLIFDMYGVPDTPGEIVIAVGDEQRTITIDGDSGLVTVTE